MKAIQITKPGEIKVIEKEIPSAGEGEALLKVLYCGICGADVASYTGNQPFTTYPRIPGHEFSAEIVSISENDRGLKLGDIVTCNPYFNCGKCYACKRGIVNACHDNQTMGIQRDGSFQEYITMPVERMIDGKGLLAKELALIEPFSISCHALSRAKVNEGDNLLIMGAGPIGLFALIRAKSMGAKVLIADMLQNRLELAKQFGADCVVNVKNSNLHDKCSEFTDGNGFDVCVEACGAPQTFLNCIDEAAHGANIILIGNGKKETTFVHSIILKKELNIFGSRNAFTKDFETLIALVKSGKADIIKMVSGIYDVDNAHEAFESLAHNDGTLAKLLINFGDK
ncbi:MAG: zinc-binding alcohol dehydrogenase family protein [Ruminococcus sp.]|nr:zinc-binding alcohol dehydrogenase family protein [Ruminococcus sp.]MDY3895467.1 zinc-binding alcohol dehydrogenase family protein [Candidatus Fimenecus sp.]